MFVVVSESKLQADWNQLEKVISDGTVITITFMFVIMCIMRDIMIRVLVVM